MVSSSPDIRPGPPARLGEQKGALASQRDPRCRMWVSAEGAALGFCIPPAAFEAADTVLHLHRVEADAVESVAASIDASAYPPDSPYIPVPLAGLASAKRHDSGK
jgi:hypothetical protein